MSQAATLLNSLYVETASETDDGVLVIDHSTRTINIPKSITNLGVESDDEVLRLRFRMPRYLGTIDLSKFPIRVNYINARAEDDVYKVTDAAVVGSNITFSWLVGPIATAYKGNTKFNVCMKIVDSDSVVQQEYNTTPATLPVLEGLECDARVVSNYTDIIEQWETRLFGIGDTEEANLQAVSEEQQEYIVNKGAEVLATIPEDYTTTYNLANESTRTKADAIIRTVEGETVKMEDSSNDHLRGLKLFGKTPQITTTGAQLFDESTLKIGYYASSEGGWVNTSSTVYRTIEIEIATAGTYTITFGGPITVIRENGETVGYEISKPYTTEIEAGTYRLSFRKNPSANWDKGYTIMFNAGSTALPYEPYSDGYASPSPAWSQPLTSIADSGNVSVAIYGGKNLMNITTSGSAAGVTETVTNGLVSFSGTATANGGRTAWKRSDVITLYPGVYYLSMVIPSGTAGQPCLTVDGETTIFAGAGKFTVTETTKVYLGFNYIIDTTYDAKNVQVQLEMGDVATEYEPYKSIQTTTFTTPDVLPAVPATSGGNYTDADGQEWICDEIDFERGVYIQRIGKMTLTGSESWGIGSSVVNGMYRFYTWAYDMRPDNSGFGLCTHYPRTPLDVDQINIECVRFGQSNVAVFFFSPSITTIDEWTAHVAELYNAGNPIAIQYVLTNPVETALTAENIAAFAELRTRYPKTIIRNDCDIHMEVSYNADAEIYINDRIEERTPRNHYVAPAITETLTGEIIGMSDASDDYLRELKLFGKTIQNGVPSPDSPVELESSGDTGSIDVVVSGKNLVTYPYAGGTSVTNNGITYTVNSDGSILVNGTATANSSFTLMTASQIVPLPLGWVYASTGIGYGSDIVQIQFDLYADDTYYGTVQTQSESAAKRELTTRSEMRGCRLKVVSGVAVNNVTVYPMVCVSELADEFTITSKQSITVPTINGLLGIPVTSGGNYTDSSGQQWICDEIDFSRSVYVKRVGRFTIDESLIYYYNTDNYFLHTTSNVFTNVGEWETRIMSSHFVPVGNGVDMYSYGWFQFNGNGGIRFRIEGIDTVESLKEWLKTNEPEVIYPFAKPVEIPLTHTQISAWKSVMLHTNYPTTYVYNDSNAGQEIAYVADTKSWIKKQFS